MQLRPDHVVRRADNAVEVAGDLGVEPKRTKWSNLWHSLLLRRPIWLTRRPWPTAAQPDEPAITDGNKRIVRYWSGLSHSGAPIPPAVRRRFQDRRGAGSPGRGLDSDASFGARCYFSAMHQDRAVHADLPAQDTAASKRDSAIAIDPSAIPATPSPAAVAAAFTDGPFEHGTDAEMIERRVRTANPLVTPSPGPGASSTLRRDVLYALRTGGPAAPDQVADRVGASRTTATDARARP